MSKITEEQLVKLQKFVGTSNELQAQVGNLEIQKAALMSQVFKNQTELSEFQKELEEEYGAVSINITDGEISEVEKE